MLRTFASLIVMISAILCTAFFSNLPSVVCAQTTTETRTEGGEENPPLRALLIAGGCCHDYAKQQEAICKGIQARANVQVDVYWTDNSTTAPMLPLYLKLNWAEDYDVIIHDECAADIKDVALVNRIVQVHQRIPAVHLHCAMHSFRTGTDAWFKHLGLQSSGHGPQEPIDIQFSETKHPITETLTDWTTIREELYNNVKVFDAQALAVGKQKVGNRTDQAIVAWVNEAQGARSFSTTIGHNTETVQDERYLELITRGLLWSCDKLNDDYLKPFEGENVVTFIDKDKFTTPSESDLGASDLGQAPEDATLVSLKASSTQNGHPTFHAIDGKRDTRWCASDGSYPQSLTLQFEKNVTPTEIEIVWEADHWYQYQVEGSTDGKSWSMLSDQSKNRQPENGPRQLAENDGIKFLRITGSKAKAGWCSIWEIRLKGKGIGTLWPADIDQKSGAWSPQQKEQFEKQGNTIPKIAKLTAEQEAEILRDVRVPDDFEVTVFAAPPAVNYPVFVAATVDGTVYVSSDGNGSLGRNPRRGRVIRLRDTDGDGRADETKIFCEIDAPRGLVWDKDRLYLMHPPHLSAFIDHDGDGVADEQKTLVKNLAFDYDQRPADHTTNGLSLGADGWLYIAGGDFGFMNAKGTDGQTLTHRGGGVIRVRPDGTDLQVYSTGTRNILEVAISPQMEMFARDNTNDGGGWDVRLHHFTGNDDHGYPRLFKNFNEECVQPLADYGGGSGCGAVYIDEPGMGRWNNAPFTADWGTGSLFRHTVEPSGATYQETAAPESFIQLTRPTDADVDGNSRVYCASWRGATFDWAGPDVGYIVCVRPKNFQPEPMPDFGKSTDEQLIAIMESPSYRRRIEAQRELLRRDNPAGWELLGQEYKKRSTDRNLLAALQEPASDANLSNCIAALNHADPVVVHTAIRSLAQKDASEVCFEALDHQQAPSDRILRALAMMHQSSVVDGLISRLDNTSSDDASSKLRTNILAALCRLHFIEGPWKGDSWGTRPDTRGPYYQPEPWSETERIARTLQVALQESKGEAATQLIATMQLNRIQMDDAIEQMIRLASNEPKLVAPTLARLIGEEPLPDSALGLLQQAVQSDDAEVLSNTGICLTRLPSPEAVELLLKSLLKMEELADTHHRQKVIRAVEQSSVIQSHVDEFIKASETPQSETTMWADAVLLTIASNEKASPEHMAAARNSINNRWNDLKHRKQLLLATAASDNRFLASQIWAAQEDKDPSVAKLATQIVTSLKIQPPSVDDSPKIGSLSLAEAHTAMVETKGNIELGKTIFTKANCTACHSLTKDEVQKGPFLGSIAKTYKRPELASAILEPSKTIAQGFATNLFLTVDGEVFTGFVTDEQSSQVTIRDQDGKEKTLLKEDIDQRKTLETSVMPEGLLKDYSVNQAASLLDFIEALSDQ